jgi:hypothetical protein
MSDRPENYLALRRHLEGTIAEFRSEVDPVDETGAQLAARLRGLAEYIEAGGTDGSPNRQRIAQMSPEEKEGGRRTHETRPRR